MARLARRGVLVIALAMAALFVLELVAVLMLLTRFAPDQARYDNAVQAASMAHAGMLDQQAGLRAFLATRDQTAPCVTRARWRL